jgi:cell division inhibitor SepF
LLVIKSNGFEFARAFAFFGFCLKLLISFNSSSEVRLMEPRSFDEMPQAIQALRERKTVILNLTMMDPDQAQRAVDFIAGGTYAIDGHQERVGESIFLFAPSCVNVTSYYPEEASPSYGPTENTPQYSLGKNTPPEPAWGNSKLSAYS